ncbi:hypothetical protein ANN_13618 [Periplaneta americana]|uniref:Uncharacterized protein n=1 Tax=Periplaneta americana TaxID=6978 RepID=A0ABQ8TLN0_PERAM|nr:hypothetical protein ANN_13618 [Periplaneta americana]
MGIRCGLVDKASARRAQNPGSNPGAGENFSPFHYSFIVIQRKNSHSSLGRNKILEIFDGQFVVLQCIEVSVNVITMSVKRKALSVSEKLEILRKVDGNSEGSSVLAFASRKTDIEGKAAYNIATSYFAHMCDANSTGENLNYQKTIMTLAVDYSNDPGKPFDANLEPVVEEGGVDLRETGDSTDAQSSPLFLEGSDGNVVIERRNIDTKVHVNDWQMNHTRPVANKGIPTRNTILRWVASFRITGSTLKKKSPGRNSIALRLSEATVRKSDLDTNPLHTDSNRIGQRRTNQMPEGEPTTYQKYSPIETIIYKSWQTFHPTTALKMAITQRSKYAYKQLLEENTQKRNNIDNEFYATSAMVDRSWAGTNQRMKNVVTRLAVHGFHLVCSTTQFHTVSEKCVCKFCGARCDKYHVLQCAKNPKTVTELSTED